jgi:flagellar L-ring protein precursor FlgH
MIRTITLAVAALVLAAAAVLSQTPATPVANTTPAPAVATPAVATTAPAPPAADAGAPAAAPAAPPAAGPAATAPPAANPAAGGPARGGAAAAPATLAVAAVPTMGTRASWLSDRRPLHVGDILTVTVAESTTASEQSTANATANRAWDGQLNVNTAGGVSAIIGPQKELATGVANNSQEEGDASRQGSLSSMLAVKITAIDALGNAQIEGSKFVQIDGRQQEMKLSGIIRADDVTYDDQVSSTRIANATISYKGKNIKPKQGFSGKILNLLWP